jgi:hypothetical protein
LSELKPGYLFGTPPGTWWEKRICQIIGAKTFHWGMIVLFDGEDWVTSESIGKGTAISRLGGRRAFIYKIKKLSEVNPARIISIHSAYGEWRYDWEVALLTALWWLFKHYLGVILPVIRDDKVNCQEWVCLLATELGVKIIPDDEYPMCTNLENSPYLEYKGKVT